MAKAKPNSDDDSEPQRPMNRAKARAQNLEWRLWEVATFEISKGNQLKASQDEVFDQANVFRKMIQCGIFAGIDEIETTVFERWGLEPPLVTTLEFATVDPPSGG